MEAPLAERIRPQKLEDYISQSHLVGPNGSLTQQIAKGIIPSLIFWGPPGTGKTHTIANLIGYLLSQGKTVLVCAHTSKALRVLRDKIDPAIRPLCLSVLDSDAESQTQLSQAAQEIVARLSGLDAKILYDEANQLRQRRLSLNEKKQNLQQFSRENIQELLGRLRYARISLGMDFRFQQHFFIRRI